MPHGRTLASGYGPLVDGSPVVISFVTVAELEYGDRRADWGHAPNRGPWCVKNGLVLGHKDHEADRWVAATTLLLGIPLVSHDLIFARVNLLDLITRLRCGSSVPPWVVAGARRRHAR